MEQQGNDLTVDQAAALGGLRRASGYAVRCDGHGSTKTRTRMNGHESSHRSSACRVSDPVGPDSPGSRAARVTTRDGHRGGRRRPGPSGEGARRRRRGSRHRAADRRARRRAGGAPWRKERRVLGDRRALDEPDRGLGAGPLGIGKGSIEFAGGGHGPHDRQKYRANRGQGNSVDSIDSSA